MRDGDEPWTARSWRQALTAYVDLKWKRPNSDPASERSYTHIDNALLNKLKVPLNDKRTRMLPRDAWVCSLQWC